MIIYRNCFFMCIIYWPKCCINGEQMNVLIYAYFDRQKRFKNKSINIIFYHLDLDINQSNIKMSFFRSDDMQSYKLIMPRQSSWDTVNTLGKYGLMHVVPEKNLQAIRPFASQLKSCDQSLLKIKSIQKFIFEHDLGKKRQFITHQQLNDLNNMWQIHQKSGGVQKSRLDQVQQQVNNIWEYQQKLVARKNQIKNKLILYRQNLAIIKAGRQQYGDAFFEIKSNFYQNSQHVSIFGLNDLEIRTAIVDDKSLVSIKRILNRVTRGNCFLNDVDYKNIYEKRFPDQQQKNVLFVIYPAKKGSVLDKKIVKILDNYCPKWQNYILPQTDTNFRQKYNKMQIDYEQMSKTFQLTKEQDKYFLKSLMGKVEGKNITQLEYYKYYLLKQRQVLAQLNQMKPHSNFIQGQVFIRKHDSQQVMQLMHKVGSEKNMPMGKLIRDESSRLPTHFQLNDFKMPSQQITNTYGVPNYQEANPSFFTLITFPFLFGVMFGDIAHGFIAFLFGIFLTFQSQNSKHSAIRMLFPYRYLITLMGFFATYCGFIYNDFLSLSLNLFKTCFNVEQATPGQAMHKTSQNCVYPFGLDPAWGVSSNYLNYVNSLKMKISVIIAVVHMTLGVFVKASNAIYFRRKLDFIFQFIPQLLFMIVFFGYMDFLIVYKWLKPWKLYDAHAPSIITTMINLPLKVGKTDKCCGGEPMWGTYGATSQDFIQFILLIIGVICIPVMLLPKPIIQICQARSHRQQHMPIPQVEGQPQVNNQLMPPPPHAVAHKMDQQQHQDASQIFVHQLIETIQYVLGCISNTASYLRLWALSLAHSQLSQVFFQKTIESGIIKGHLGIPILLLAFPILAGSTFGVLLCMDSMQCFLHTLRLHWVEFQNKFYKGNGFLFEPYNFKSRIRQAVSKSA